MMKVTTYYMLGVATERKVRVKYGKVLYEGWGRSTIAREKYKITREQEEPAESTRRVTSGSLWLAGGGRAWPEEVGQPTTLSWGCYRRWGGRLPKISWPVESGQRGPKSGHLEQKWPLSIEEAGRPACGGDRRQVCEWVG